jgi:uncharacterized repeat protein (TIGR02543 family)
VGRRKRFKKWIAFALAAVVTATSVMPATLQEVYAETALDPGNPFGQNVAENKAVTVLNANGEKDEAKSEEASALINGEVETTGNTFEAGYEYEDGKKKLELVIDLRGEFFVDSVNIYWRNAAAAMEYQVLTSINNEDWTLVSMDKVSTLSEGGNEATTETKSAFTEHNVRYVKIFCTEERAYGVFSIREIKVNTIGTVEEEVSPNYALGKPAHASVGDDTAKNLTNGSYDDFWTTGDLSEENLPTPVCYIDLIEEKTLNKIKWRFEGAYAKKSVVKTATDPEAIKPENRDDENYWTTWGTVELDSNENLDVEVSPSNDGEIEARYVMITMTEPIVAVWGIKIYEVEALYERDELTVKDVYLSRTETYAFSEIGATLQLYAQALPMNAENAEITWSSSNEQVATVSKDGLVTAVGQGMATIEASAGGKKNSVNVTLADELASPVVTAKASKGENGENIIKVSWTMPEEAGDDIKYILRRRRDNEALTWIKQIDENFGSTEYTDEMVLPGRSYQYCVKAYQGTAEDLKAASEWSYSEPVTIEVATTSLTMSQAAATLGIRNGKAESLQLRVTKEPAEATDRVLWKSSNDSVAIVNENGYVTAKGAGTAVITAWAEGNESVTASCAVTVKEQLATPDVTAEKTDEDEITLNWNKVDNADTYQIYRAEGKDAAEKDFELLSAGESGIVVEDTTVRYTDTINTDEKLGNYYSYKVAAAPAEGSDYTLGEKSAATKQIAIGTVNTFGTNIALGKKVTTSAETETGNLEMLTDGVATDANAFWESKVADGGDSESASEQPVGNMTFDVDLGNVYNINKVKVYWRGITKATEYVISVLPEGGNDYVQVADQNDAKEVEEAVIECAFAYQRAQHVRITVTKTVGYAKCGIREIEVYTPGTVTMEDPTLTRILLSQRTARMSVGDKLDLYVQKLPANAVENITWTAVKGHGEGTTGDSAEEFVSLKEIDGNCKVTALAPGIVTVWAHAHEAEAAGNTDDKYHRNCKIVITGKLEAPTVTASIEPTEEKSIEVSWNAVDHADKYNLYRTVGEKPAGEAELIAEGLTETTYNDTNVEVGKYYSYQVVAVNESETIPDTDPAEKLYEDSEKSEATEPIPVPIHVESISLDKTRETITIQPQEADSRTLKLTATNNPENATFGFTWESSDEEVVTVSEEGLVTAVGVGTATITARTKDEKSTASASCEITVKEQLATPEIATAVADDEKSITISVKEAVDHAASYKLEKSVDDGTYTEISEAGLTPDNSYQDEDVEPGKTYKYKVTALPAAEDTDYVESESAESEGDRIAVRITKITLKKGAEYEIGLGEELQLEAVIEPENVDDDLKALKWTVSEGTCVEVDEESGLVTANGLGTANVTVQVVDEKSTAEAATCTITVRKRLAAPEVTVVQSADKSSVTVSWNMVENAASYKLWKTIDEDEAVELDVSKIEPADGKMTYTDAVEKGHTYTYKVVAAPESAEYLENEGSADPVKVKDDLNVPTGVKAAVSGQNVTVTWTAVANATGYLVQRSTNGTTFTSLATITEAKYEDKNLAVGTYYYKVIAKGNDDYDDSKESSVVTATITTTSQQTTKYTVTFNSNGGTSVAAQIVEAGKTAKTPTAPTRSGYTFAGWYNGATAYNFNTPVNSNLTLTAKWTANAVKVTKVSITGNSKKIAAGKKITLKANVAPANASKKKVTWKSSNTKYATVSQSGVVTTKKAGAGKTVTITATAQDGSNKKATYKITIMNKAVKKVKLTAKTKTVKAGKKLTVKATVTLTAKIDKKSKSTKANKTVEWKSSNKKYATVSTKGVVTANKAGKGKTVTITATATDGSKKKATIKIKISK